MTKGPASRKPATFRLDDPHVVVAEPRSAEVASTAATRRGAVVVTPMPEAANVPTAGPWPREPRRRISLATVFWSATGGLLALALGLAAVGLIEDLFARAAWLGWLGAGLAGIAGVVGGTFQSISPGEDTRFLLASLVVVIVGGMGSIPGAALGALIIGLAEQLGSVYIPTYAIVVTFLIMVLVLALRPQGLLARR